MTRLTIRFHGDLNDFFLLRARRESAIIYDVEGTPSLKDVVESLGVPHTEVGALLVNGASVPFTMLARAGDQIEAYAVAAPLPPVTPIYHLQPPAPTPARFVLDVHLGRLAAYLRPLGFDTRYQNFCDDDVLARISSEEERILLTRDVGLLKRGIVVYGHFVRATQPEAQLREVVERFHLGASFAPFERCLRCNGLLDPVSPASVANELPANVARDYDEFFRCQSCAQVYWKGTHYERMRELIERMAQAGADAS
ncbi:MAG: Mut7-C RNAse domain-containing protein [Ktedonobacterales bacterium]